jgi:hypothetical protein
VLESAGLPRPKAEAWWYEAFRRGDFEQFDKAFAEFTEPISKAEQYALAIFREPGNRGFAIVVDNGLVTATPEKGVTWTYLGSIQPQSFHRLRQ